LFIYMKHYPYVSRRHGFALIVALSLMGFVTLLLLSLSSLIMVEITTSTQNKIMEQARLNAKLGLYEAIGQLQKLAGPDQRITAAAASLDDNPATTAIDGVGNARYWTGVWNAEYPTDSNGNPISVRNASTDGSLLQYNAPGNRRKDSTAANSRFLGWLISGQMDYSDAATYAPDPDSDALLVGSGSVANALNGDGSPNEAVYVPKEIIRATDGTETGRYAYWVEDEGLKARFNLRDTHLDNANATERRYSLLTAQRSGVENMDALAGTAFPINDAVIDKMHSESGLSSYLDSNTAVKEGFHDLTAYSAGLLTDVKHGGLKKDLTWFFERPDNEAVPQSLEDISYYATTSPSNRYSTSEPRVADFPQPQNVFCEPSPTWKKLRSFYHLKDQYGVSGSIQPRPNDDTTYPIGPLAIYTVLSLFPEIRPVGSDLYLRVHMSFQVVLWNPYDVPLSAHSYDVEFMSSGTTTVLYPQFVFDESVTGNSGDNPQSKDGRWYYPNSVVARHHNLNTNGGMPSSDPIDGVFQHTDMTSFRDEYGLTTAGVVFRTPAIALDPGEVVLLSIDNANNDPYVEGFELALGDNGGSVYLDYPDPLPAKVSQGIAHLDKEGNTYHTYPKFHWRLWRSWGGADSELGSDYDPPSSSGNVIDLDSSNPYGEIRGFGLREQVAEGDDRDLKNGTAASEPVVGLDSYYSRLFRENNARAEIGGESKYFVARTTLPIAQDVKQPDDSYARVINSDWSGPNFNAKIEYQSHMYPFDEGPDATGSRPAALVHRNPTAMESRRDGFHYEGSAVNGNNYGAFVCMGWDSGPQYSSYGNSISIESTATGNAYFGRSYNQSSHGRTHVPLLSVPDENEPILSLGFFQHANLLREDTTPAFQIGNSFPEIRLESLTETVRDSNDTDDDLVYDISTAGKDSQSIIDSTYLLNDALWDRFFLSSYEDPENILDPDFTPPNARMQRIDSNENIPDSAIDDFFDMAAAYLAVNGAFNVNSTSVEAWKAALGSLSGLDIDPENANPIGTAHNRLVSHFSSPEGGADDTSENDLWTGYRELTDVQLTALAQAMVEQVKTRGPFLSMSEFVNRRLANDETGYRGALQAAIDSLDYTDDGALSTADTAINGNAGTTFGTANITGDGSPGLPPELFIEEAARAHQYTGVSAWVTQGDILQAIGPSLTVRSDTFRIRAYGEAIEPLTGNVQGKAWCEAIVQRLPTPVTPGSDDASTPEYYEPDDVFGRKFKIVSFRWLSSNEI
jgi:hypothetical protein